MRIIYKDKDRLLDLIEHNELKIGDFEVQATSDHTLKIQSRSDYFSFELDKEGNDVYAVKIFSTTNNQPEGHRATWHSVEKLFGIWLVSIKVDQDYKSKFFSRYSHRSLPDLPGVTMRFSTVYRQAELAETYRLDEVCGLGYRKAFEIMLKEYLMSGKTDDEIEEIKELNASTCINKYVASDEIKIIASRVLWLGNDHAHYLKKFPERDILDLKTLIDKTITWIMQHEEWKSLQAAMTAEAKSMEAEISRR